MIQQRRPHSASSSGVGGGMMTGASPPPPPPPRHGGGGGSGGAATPSPHLAGGGGGGASPYVGGGGGGGGGGGYHHQQQSPYGAGARGGGGGGGSGTSYSSSYHPPPQPSSSRKTISSSSTAASSGNNNPFRSTKKKYSSSSSSYSSNHPSNTIPLITGVYMKFIFTILLLISIPLCIVYSRKSLSKIRSQIEKWERENSYGERSISRMESQISRQLKDAETLNSRLNTLGKEHATLKANPPLPGRKVNVGQPPGQQQPPAAAAAASRGGGGEIPNDEYAEQVKIRDVAIMERVDALRNYIGKESKREVLDKFGPEPHRVKITVAIPEDSQKSESFQSFLIELAPLHLMPHSVHVFLDQVSHTLWDGCSFVINAHHVLQASPVGPQRGQRSKLPFFENKNLGALSFQEYSPQYPHVRYSVGYAGRPAGPDFYINMDDNRAHHGPGGQKQHDLVEEADPCFGRIIAGFDTLENMRKQESDKKGMLKRRIVIVKAEVVIADEVREEFGMNDPNLQQQQQQQGHGGNMMDEDEYKVYHEQMDKEWETQDTRDSEIQSNSDYKHYCGPCFGAATEELKCCNTCDELLEAYRIKRWNTEALFNEAEQCLREGRTKGAEEENGDEYGLKEDGEQYNQQGDSPPG